MQQIELDIYASTEPFGSQKFCQYVGDVYVNNVKAEANTVIKAVDNNSFICGMAAITTTGEGYNMMVYGDDNENTPMAYQDEGAEDGEVVQFVVQPAGYSEYFSAVADPADVQWVQNGSNGVDLYVFTGEVIVTNKFCDFTGVNCILGGVKVPAGSEVEAYFGDGTLCGVAENVVSGAFTMRVYGDDERTANIVEGPVNNDELTFYINGIKAELAENSQDDNVYQVSGNKTITLVAPVTNVAPAAPASITATNNGDYTVTAAWTAVPEDDIKGYRVLRKDNNGAATVIAALVEDAVEFVDNTVEFGHSYSYGVVAIDEYDLESGETWSNTVVDVNESSSVKEKFFLKQNFPNPFNSYTTISFGLKEAQNVKLTIYNVLGEEMNTVINEHLSAGTHEIVWNGKDKNQKSVPSGIYYYKIKTDDASLVKKMLYLK